MISRVSAVPEHREAAPPQGGRPQAQRRATGAPLPAPSPKGVVLRVVRSAMAEEWTPFAAADDLVSYVDDDVRLLEIARARIHACVLDSSTVMQARALATLNVAITKVREQQGLR